jgi:hypothetical protein
MAIDGHVFKQNLLLTQLYCELQLRNTDKNYASILRSFNPKSEGQSLFKFGLVTYNTIENEIRCFFNADWSSDPFTDKHLGLIKELFNKQREHKLAVISAVQPTNSAQGKIVVIQIDETVVDGASEAESSGLFDIYDLPPIDTWVYIDNDSNRLFAWIPSPFVHLADQAIAVNCMDCICWFDDHYTKEFQLLKL